MSKPHEQSAIPLKERRKPLAKKEYFCTLVSENVEIVLKTKPHISRKSDGEMFVQCNQLECQYVDNNRHPCPLHLDLFADEIERREEKRRDRRM